MDGLNVKKLRSLAQSLEEIFLCPVCLGILQSETVSCIKGHVICKKCKGVQTVCPTCRCNFANVQSNSLVRQVLEVLPHKCRYKDCVELVQFGDDHEFYCGFKPTTCRYCGWTGPGNQLLNHIKEKHSTVHIFKETNCICESDEFFLDKNWSCSTPFSIFGFVLWQHRSYNPGSGYLTDTFHVVYNGKPEHDIFVKLSFESEKKDYTAIIKLSTDMDIDSAKENCISVPNSILHHFYDKENSSLLYEIRISETKD